ncbi:MAG: riboflavin synthase [Planctomycetota bacterium]
MFTGIIETVGTVRRLLSKDEQMQITVEIGPIAEGTALGDSIAVNGVCLTVCRLDGATAAFDVSTETVRRSSLAALKSGSKVNLERAMSAQDRFGGHIVQGHVDGTAKITAIRKQANFAEFRFEASAELLKQMVPKGSVAIDGISLTVEKLDTTGFEVALIPTTLAETTWCQAKAGDIVNIETDILVKIIQQQLAAIVPGSKSLTLEQLREHGF